ncbi:hypothetical protein H5410_061939 [Solanum commersonii]|uniref:Uncharacterized protein n=1 Tax=Solanum commersonii TaxID=4109 RepID=A0A9J5W9B5_SOLCO|nr:hypothetical protein H5410_061939 [Solanum commersonii]
MRRLALLELTLLAIPVASDLGWIILIIFLSMLIRMIEMCQHETKIRIIKWNRPPKNIQKLNTNGSAQNNSRQLEENIS